MQAKLAENDARIEALLAKVAAEMDELVKERARTKVRSFLLGLVLPCSLHFLVAGQPR